MANRGITHIEIPATSRPELGQFYAELFGWEITPMEDMNYGLFKSGNVAGGFPTVDEHFKPGDVILYIDSNDIEADLKAIEKKGGKILQARTEIPGFGWYGMFADPTGNRLGLYTGLPQS